MLPVCVIFGHKKILMIIFEQMYMIVLPKQQVLPHKKMVNAKMGTVEKLCLAYLFSKILQIRKNKNWKHDVVHFWITLDVVFSFFYNFQFSITFERIPKAHLFILYFFVAYSTFKIFGKMFYYFFPIFMKIAFSTIC